MFAPAPRSLVRRSLSSLPLALLALPAGAAALSGGGCAAMEQARLDNINRSVTVSARDPLYHYRRVGLEPSTCEGALCANVSAPEFERQVEQAAGGACYEVIGADEVARYTQAYGGKIGLPFQLAHPFGVDIQDKTAEKILGGWDQIASWALDAAQPDVRDVVVDELDLDGALKSNISVGEPDSINGFRTVTVDLKLVDAFGRQNLWQARLQETLMSEDRIGDVMQALGRDMRDALSRRASACGSDPVAEQPKFDAFEVGADEKIDLPERVHFELASAKLSERSSEMLARVADFLSSRTDIAHVRVEGHTDGDGDDADNMALSVARANAVRDFLVSEGIASARLEAAGFGETRPLFPNDSVTNKAKNRRVDLFVVK